MTSGSPAAVSVDGVPYRGPEHMQYKAMMLTDVPNFVFCMGYTNASWTLKSTLTAKFLCRLVNHMFDRPRGKAYSLARVHSSPDVKPNPDFMQLTSGYVSRAREDLPQEGDKAPFKLSMNYLYDKMQLDWGTLDDGHLRFEYAAPRARL